MERCDGFLGDIDSKMTSILTLCFDKKTRTRKKPQRNDQSKIQPITSRNANSIRVLLAAVMRRHRNVTLEDIL